MTPEIVADLRVMLPRSVVVSLAPRGVSLTHAGQTALLSPSAAEALLRRLPAIPCAASLSMVEALTEADQRAAEVRRLRSGLRWLRRPSWRVSDV